MERLADLREPPVVGRFYLVPVIRSFVYTGRLDDWPVIGALHSDADFFNFKDVHYHVDARFLTKAQHSYLTSGWGDPDCYTIEHIVGSKPLAHNYISMPKGRPPLVRRKCQRVTYGHAFGHRKEVVALCKHFAGRLDAIALADGRKLCPHRRADLTQFPVEPDGTVLCPLHGLRIRVDQPARTTGAA